MVLGRKYDFKFPDYKKNIQLTGLLRLIVNKVITETEVKQMNKNDFETLVQQAREKNIVEYFRESGYSVEKKSSNYYVSEIAGLCLKSDNNQWYYH